MHACNRTHRQTNKLKTKAPATSTGGAEALKLCCKNYLYARKWCRKCLNCQHYTFWELYAVLQTMSSSCRPCFYWLTLLLWTISIFSTERSVFTDVTASIASVNACRKHNSRHFNLMAAYYLDRDSQSGNSALFVCLLCIYNSYEYFIYTVVYIYRCSGEIKRTKRMPWIIVNGGRW